ncbi:MAG: DUF1570 domain-containing protein [Planctomycetota bacterium]|nr:DUF1570 domain-containing protein [Planctomycetota bacterium]
MRGRTEPVVFFLALLAGWIAAALFDGGPSRTQGAEDLIAAMPEAMRGEALLTAGAKAETRGDSVEAARLYRQAWRHREARYRAATALRSMHSRGLHEIPVDELALEKTRLALGPEFTRMDTAHFVVLSNAGSEWTRSRAALLERTYHQFFRVMDRLEYPAVPPEQKLMCVLIRDHAMYAAFAKTQDGVDAPWIAGYYAGRSNRIVFYDDQTSPAFAEALKSLDTHEKDIKEARQRARDARRNRQGELAERLEAHADDLERRIALERRRLQGEAARSSEAKTVHEAVHLLAFNTGVQSRSHSYPFWITEGLASAFETESPRAAFGPDHVTATRQGDFERHLINGQLMPTDALVALSRVPDAEATTADVMYSQSYALVAYMFRYERRSLAQYLLDILDEPAGRIDASRHGEIFAARFGDPGDFEARFLKRAGSGLAQAALATAP